MAEPYLTRLKGIIERFGSLEIDDAKLEAKHFFSGAALYANGKIFASMSPAGFAIKLPTDRRKRFIDAGIGTEFRFFASGPIKQEYVALSGLTVADEKVLQELVNLSVTYVL